MRKTPVVLTLILAMTALVGCSSQSNKVIQGVIEAPILSQVCEVSGKIVSLEVQLGQEVKQGDIIAQLDDSDSKYALEQLEEVLITKELNLALLEKGADEQQLQQGRNNVTIAQQNLAQSTATLATLQKEYQKQDILYQQGALPLATMENIQEQIDAAQRAEVIAAAQLDNAKQQLSLLSGDGNEEKIQAAQEIGRASCRERVLRLV